MSETTQSDLRGAIEFMKNDSGSGTKARKQERFVSIYEPEVAHIVAGERYDDAGVGPKTAQSAVESAYPTLEVDEYDTLTEALAPVVGGDTESLDELVADLDAIAELSGNEQKSAVVDALLKHSEPSLVTLALLDDESIGLGTSQMREAFFDGTRDERKRREAFTNSTSEFISLAQQDNLDTSPTVGEPFAPMLAVPESRGEPENPVAQRKVDGYRVLLHVTDGTTTAFSRARNDATESLPELDEIDWPEGDYILDGEVIAENDSYSDTSERIGRSAENVERDIEMNFSLFDILVNDGEEVWEDKYTERQSALVSLVTDIDDDRVFHLGSKYDIALAKDEAMQAGDEGIIVKDASAPYEFGKRSSYWQKQKYDDETCDVIISGFQQGDGKATGTLGAVALESADGSHMGSSGSGFTDAQRAEIWNNQDEYLGEVIEVEARGVGSQGLLRMPIFKRHRPEGEADSRERIEEVMDDV